ncbi:hypothetical protein [Flavobacterium sp. 9AF]|uniref:hypothetical protein n=1 Tax=Flavobacterium sp. 9AF TaxID=2653142 RepID=UPI001356781C|nr:hypothetical protein [Flavobacterium sp. 9AF]
MKKLIFSMSLVIGFCLAGFSQSNNGSINGYFTVILGQPTTFSVNTFEKLDTYEWSVNTNLTQIKNKKNLGSLKIIGKNDENLLIVEPTALGVFSIEVVYTDSKGYHTASFIGNVVNPIDIQKEESITSLDESKKQNK